MKAIHTLAATFLLIAASSVVAAYPIPPQALRHLYEESDLIVVARVGETTPFKDEKDWYSGKVTLQVSSVLKGPEYTQYVDVYHNPGMICPAPPTYQEGKTVLAFLRVADDRAGYFTTGLSYGTKYLSESDLQIYTDRINELARLTAEEKVRTVEIVEWLVRCAEETATRWEGAYELFTTSNNRREETGSIPFASMLTEEQKYRLTEAFFRSKTISGGEWVMLDFIKGRKDARFAPFMISYLNSVADDPGYGLGHLMLLVAQDSQNKGFTRLTKQLARQYDDIYASDDEAQSQRKGILRSFINEFDKAEARY